MWKALSWGNFTKYSWLKTNTSLLKAKYKRHIENLIKHQRLSFFAKIVDDDDDDDDDDDELLLWYG